MGAQNRIPDGGRIACIRVIQGGMMFRDSLQLDRRYVEEREDNSKQIRQ